MLTIQPNPLQEQESAVEFLKQTMEGRERLLLQIAATSKEMRISHDPSRFLLARHSLIEYLSAAYATKNRQVFDAALDSLMSHPLPEGTEWFRPTAAQLGMDLAIALSCQRDDWAHGIGAQIMRSGTGRDAAPEDLQAHTLALLAARDYDRAASMVARMREAIAAANLSIRDKDILSAWANVAEDVAARSDLALNGDLQKITQKRNAYVSKSLARWRKGQNTELTAIDFWDTHTTALTVIAHGIGLGTLAPAEMPFANA
jgi:hypothetical protein